MTTPRKDVGQGSRSVRIANGQAFWGDWREAPRQLVTRGDIDYLTLDYLAEITMSLLNKQRSRRPELGYAVDFVELMRDLLPECMDRGIKIVSNAGGLNPEGCRDAVLQVAKELGLSDVKVASIAGDDLMPVLDSLVADGEAFRNMDDGRNLKTIRDQLVSANAYLGAGPIVDALRRGADVVIAGRCTDPALVLGPAMFEFGWDEDDFDRLALATVAGHIIECGAQCTGGNFEGGWWRVPNISDIGYPIVEIGPSGEFIVTKPVGTGGIVDEQTVGEQVLYELGDPSHYLSPDVIVDLSQIELEVVGPDRVRVTGVNGSAPPQTLKVSAAYSDGFISSGQLVYCWPSALAKAKRGAEMFRQRIDALSLGIDLEVEFIGCDAVLRGLTDVELSHEPSEVVLRVTARSHNAEALTRFGMEFAPVAIGGPAAATGFAAGRPKPSQVIGYWPALVDRSRVRAVVEVQST